MALDVLDELADLRRRSLGLLVLDADQRTLVVLIEKPRFGKRVDRQSRANHGDEQRDVSPEQTASSARRRGCRTGTTDGIRLVRCLSPKQVSDRLPKARRSPRAPRVIAATRFVASLG